MHSLLQPVLQPLLQLPPPPPLAVAAAAALSASVLLYRWAPRRYIAPDGQIHLAPHCTVEAASAAAAAAAAAATTAAPARPAPPPLLAASRAAHPHRSDLVESPEEWMRDKAAVDQRMQHGLTPHLWAIHGKLYDLSDFVASHPGGPAWLRMMRGSDCTEAYEIHHVNHAKTDAILAQYYVGDVQEFDEGYARYTFEETGFYATLRRRAIALLNNETSPMPWFLNLCRAAVTGFAVLFSAVCVTGSIPLSFGGGVLLVGMMGIGHNFFHQRDSLWRYCFDLTLFSHHVWRMSHAISHHIYPNMDIDIEASGLEPMLYFLDNRPKNHIFVFIGFNLLAMVACYVEHLRHLAACLIGRESLRPENFIAPAELGLLAYFQGWRGVLCFCVMQSFASWLFVSTSFVVHRTEAAWTEGDPGGKMDFGEHVVLSTCDHSVNLPICISLFSFALLNYHILHHLFPTVDHSRLRQLHSVLVETCREFGYEYKSNPFWSSLRSMLRRHDINV